MSKIIALYLNPKEYSTKIEFINFGNIISFGISDGAKLKINPYFYIKTVDEIFYKTSTSPEEIQESLIDFISSDSVKIMEIESNSRGDMFYFDK